MYDPLGFISPLILPSKLLLQELCKRNIGWDNEMPQTLSRQWSEWLQDLNKVAMVKVDRCIRPNNFGTIRMAQLQISLDKSMFFADRQTVLKYIANHTKRLHTFVVIKVSVIRDTTEVVQWRHIGTKLNPADNDASRGMSIEHFLKSSRWIQCPNFLLEASEEWPQLLLFQTVLTVLLINS